MFSRPKGQKSCPDCRPGELCEPRSTGIDKVHSVAGNGLQVLSKKRHLWPAWGDYSFLPPFCRPTAQPSPLRRCTCGGMIGMPLFHPDPLIRGFKNENGLERAMSEEVARNMHSLNLSPSPNLALQRAGTHKVLGRGRSGMLLEQVMRARVLISRRAVAELSS